MTNFIGGKITIVLCKLMALCALALCLSLAQSYSAPRDQTACEAQYQQCIKRIAGSYSRGKIACESSFRQCLRGK